MKSSTSCITEIKKQTALFALYFVVVLVTLCIGTLIFFYIEHCYDIVQPKLSQNDAALERICQAIAALNGTAEEANVTIVNDIRTICQHSDLQRETIECVINRYTFGKWFDFTTSVSFTTGFGRVVPLSKLGKVATILYAVPSIAFCMTLYITTGRLITVIVAFLIYKIEEMTTKRKKIPLLQWRILSLNIMFCIVLCFVFGVPSGYATEGDPDYFDSFYFGFMTITTIGFGDYSYNSELLSRKFHMFLIHAILFSICTGSVTSVIASLNIVFTKKNMATKKLETIIDRDRKVGRNQNQEQVSAPPSTRTPTDEVLDLKDTDDSQWKHFNSSSNNLESNFSSVIHNSLIIMEGVLNQSFESKDSSPQNEND